MSGNSSVFRLINRPDIIENDFHFHFHTIKIHAKFLVKAARYFDRRVYDSSAVGACFEDVRYFIGSRLGSS